jgi:hypothetical protein
MRLGHGHTSDRNELSSSGTLTGATSKNLNCHFSRVSFAMRRGVVPPSAYRSDCHTVATVPYSLLPQKPELSRPGEAWGRHGDKHASARFGLVARRLSAASPSRTSALSPLPFSITPTIHFNFTFVRHHPRPSLLCVRPSTRPQLYLRLSALESSLLIRAAPPKQRAPLCQTVPVRLRPQPLHNLSNHHFH